MKGKGGREEDEVRIRLIVIYSFSLPLFISAEPPDSPDVTHNDSSLCLSAYSRAELPVLYFDVVVMDVTGIPSNLTGRHYVTSGNKICLPITSDSTPNICPPIQVSATATNVVGESGESITSNIGLSVLCMDIFAI